MCCGVCFFFANRNRFVQYVLYFDLKIAFGNSRGFFFFTVPLCWTAIEFSRVAATYSSCVRLHTLQCGISSPPIRFHRRKHTQKKSNLSFHPNASHGVYVLFIFRTIVDYLYIRIGSLACWKEANGDRRSIDMAVKVNENCTKKNNQNAHGMACIRMTTVCPYWVCSVYAYLE